MIYSILSWSNMKLCSAVPLCSQWICQVRSSVCKTCAWMLWENLGRLIELITSFVQPLRLTVGRLDSGNLCWVCWTHFIKQACRLGNTGLETEDFKPSFKLLKFQSVRCLCSPTQIGHTRWCRPSHCEDLQRCLLSIYMQEALPRTRHKTTGFI